MTRLGDRLRPFPSTAGGAVNLATIGGRSVVFVYPRTTPPGGRPAGWEDIPGAPGCTAQACAFRDLASEFRLLGYSLFGLSAQTTAYQAEAADRLHLGYPLLSDVALQLRDLVGFETFRFGELEVYRRATLVLDHGEILHLFKNINNPATHPAEVLGWIRQVSRTGDE